MADPFKPEGPAGAGKPREWPVEASSLDALTDLGLSDTQIARYFKVSSAKVTTLRETQRETA